MGVKKGDIPVVDICKEDLNYKRTGRRRRIQDKECEEEDVLPKERNASSITGSSTVRESSQFTGAGLINLLHSF
ncbi:unnamed protein product [Nezara viridula]|uniref:Uncharacterized protein n=1 Tax=Nezara viridula TaxID=85310 RepID=A0A9P0MRU1_NEZVI|nr:unnamed protein product [Nezara viridula]